MKVQRILRLQSEMYQKIKDMASSAGVSINSLIIFLIEMGMKTYDAIGAETPKGKNKAQK